MAMSKMNSFDSMNGPNEAELHLASADKTRAMTATFDYLRNPVSATGMAPYIKNKLLLLDKGDLEAWIAAAPSKRSFLHDALIDGEVFRAAGDSKGPDTREAFAERGTSPWPYLRTLLEVECYEPYGEAFMICGQHCLDKLAQLNATGTVSKAHVDAARQFITNRWCNEPIKHVREPGLYEHKMADDDETGTIGMFLAMISTSTPVLPAFLKNAMMTNVADIVLEQWLREAPAMCPHISNALFERGILHKMQWAGVLPKPRTQMEMLVQACDAFDEDNPAELLQAMLEIESYNPYGLTDPTFMQKTACPYVGNVLRQYWAVPKVRVALLFMFRRWQYWPGQGCEELPTLMVQFLAVCWRAADPLWREFFVATDDAADDKTRYEILVECWHSDRDECIAMMTQKTSGSDDGALRTLAFLCKHAELHMSRNILLDCVEELLHCAHELSPVLVAAWQLTVKTIKMEMPNENPAFDDQLRNYVLKHPEMYSPLWLFYGVNMEGKDADKLTSFLKGVLIMINCYTSTNLARVAQGLPSANTQEVNAMYGKVEIGVAVLAHEDYEGIAFSMGVLHNVARCHSRALPFMLEVLDDLVLAVYKLDSLYYEMLNMAQQNPSAVHLIDHKNHVLNALGSAEDALYCVAEDDSTAVVQAIKTCPHMGRKFRPFMEKLPCHTKLQLIDVFSTHYCGKREYFKLERLLRELVSLDFTASLQCGAFTYGLLLESPKYSFNVYTADLDVLTRAQVAYKHEQMQHEEYEITDAHEFVYFCKTFDSLPLPKVSQDVIPALQKLGGDGARDDEEVNWIFNALTVCPKFRRRYLGRHLQMLTALWATKLHRNPHYKVKFNGKPSPDCFNQVLLNSEIYTLITLYL